MGCIKQYYSLADNFNLVLPVIKWDIQITEKLRDKNFRLNFISELWTVKPEGATGNLKVVVQMNWADIGLSVENFAGWALSSAEFL